MTLTELLTEVYTQTNRPDLVARTLSAVRSATLKYHTLEFFKNDVAEVGITFPTANYLQQIDVSSDDVLAKFRALQYIRRTDSSNNVGKLLEIIEPENFQDQYGYLRSDVAYVAGQNIQIKSSVDFQYAIVGYYKLPLVGTTDGTFSSWIATKYPWVIIYEASKIVCAATGKREAAADFANLTAESWQGLLISNPPNMVGS